MRPLVTLGAAALLSASLAWGADRPAAKAGRPAASPITVEEVQTRIDRLPNEPHLDDAQRARVRARLDAALESLRAAESWQQKGEQLAAERAGAGDLAATSRSRAASLAEEPAVEPPPHATLDDLNSMLEQAEQELAAAQDRLTAANTALEERTTWRRESPARIAALRTRLPEIDHQLALPLPAGEPRAVTEARDLALRAERLAVERELGVRQADADARDRPRGRLRAQQEEAAAETAKLRKDVDLLKAARLQWRRRDADATTAEAEEAVKSASPVARPVAEANARIAALRGGPEGLAARVEQGAADLERIRQQQASLQSELTDVQAKVARMGTTDAVGLMLQKKLRELPAEGPTRANLRARKQVVRDVELKLLDLSEQRADLAKDLDQAALRELGPSVGDPAVRAEARRLLEARFKYLDAATRDLNRLFNGLVDLDGAERELLATIAAYRTYLDARVLWVPIAGMLDPGTLADAWTGARWLLAPRSWGAALAASFGLAMRSWGIGLLLTAFVAVALLLRRPATRRLKQESSKIPASLAPWTNAAIALGWTALCAARWPAILWAASWFLMTPADAPPVALAVGLALQRLVSPLLLIHLTHGLCIPGGLGGHALGWTEAKIAGLRKTMAVLTRFLVPTVLLANAFYAHYRSYGHRWAETSGRLAYLAAMAALATAGWHLVDAGDGTASRRRLRNLWRTLSILVPLVLGGLAVAGYIHTSLRLTGALFWTVWLVAGARTVLGMARHLPIRGGGESPDAAEVSEQLLRLLRSIAIIAVGIGLWYLWSDLVPALGYLRTIDLWTIETKTGIASVTLASVLLSLLIAVTTFGVARNLRGVLRAVLPRALHVDTGVGYAVASLVRYGVILVGAMASLGAIGIGWGRAQWAVAGLSVGLGFGLQEMFANLVAGLIVLFERSIRVGDVVTVGGVDGEVTRIRIRATTIQAFDYKELIIPNRELVTATVVNWTLTQNVCRITVPIGAAYGSDTAKVEEVLLKIARENPTVLRSPPPRVVFEQFGESALQFKLYVFLPDRRLQFDALHQLNVAIDRELREAGITIAFPQRDVRLTAPLDVRVVPPDPGGGSAP